MSRVQQPDFSTQNQPIASDYIRSDRDLGTSESYETEKHRRDWYSSAKEHRCNKMHIKGKTKKQNKTPRNSSFTNLVVNNCSTCSREYQWSESTSQLRRRIADICSF